PLPAAMNVGQAVAQLAAGRIIAGADDREAVADVEDVVPVLQPDAAVDAELEQLDPVDITPGEVGIDRLGVAAVGVERVAPPLPRLAADLAEGWPAVGVVALPLADEIVAEEQVEVAVGPRPVFLARDDAERPARPLGYRPEPAELGVIQFFAHPRVR